MICPQCNNNLADGVFYCPYCRKPLSELTANTQDTPGEIDNGYTTTPSSKNGSDYSNNPNRLYNTYSGNPNTNNNGYANNPNSSYNTYSGNPNANNNSYLHNRMNKPVYPPHLLADNPPQEEEYFPMTWYKILTYFLLPLGAVMNVYYGKKILSGNQFQEIKDIIYTLFPSLKVVDTAAGVFCLFMAVWAGLTCVWLWRKKKVALVSLYGYCIVNYGSTILLYVAYCCILPSDLFSAHRFLWEILRSVFIGIFMTVANYKYFHKRCSLFVN